MKVAINLIKVQYYDVIKLYSLLSDYFSFGHFYNLLFYTILKLLLVIIVLFYTLYFLKFLFKMQIINVTISAIYFIKNKNITVILLCCFFFFFYKRHVSSYKQVRGGLCAKRSLWRILEYFLF